MVYHDSVFSAFAKKIEKCQKVSVAYVRGIPRPWYTTGCGIPRLWYTIGVRLKDYSKTMVYHAFCARYTYGIPWVGEAAVVYQEPLPRAL